MQKLLYFGRETAKIANELVHLLDLTLAAGGRNKVWKSFRQALVAVSNKRRIAELSERLDTFRNELVLRVVVSLKLAHKLDSVQQDERYRSLEVQTKRIADALLDNKNFFTKGIGKVLQGQEDGVRSAQIRHEETIAAMATLQASMEGLTILSHELNREVLPDLREIQQQILDFLWFRFMRDRIEEVSTAYGATFNWSFDSTNSSFCAWDSLSVWLSQGEGCYWVNGKAGSGKSTFLKYIADHPQTMDLLRLWAGDQSLLCARFFFWGAGTVLQKSQPGLLRSILYESLTQYPELVPVVFPIHCRRFARSHLIANEPSLPELKEAFRNLAEQTIVPMKICIFIDGLDEYGGNSLELTEFLLSIVSTRTKILLTSRPTPQSTEAFTGRPSLRLQDLTYEDIRTYVNGNLMCDPRVQELLRQDEQSVTNLREEIVTKASGVFLWVVLIVKTLRVGLMCSDNVTELQARLDELPTDLDKVYAKMMDQMDESYKCQAAALFQLMYQSTKVPGEDHMTLLRLSLAFDTNPDAAIDALTQRMNEQEMRQRCQRMEALIKSRCCGLLEVRDSDHYTRFANMFDEPIIRDFAARMEVAFFDLSQRVSDQGPVTRRRRRLVPRQQNYDHVEPDEQNLLQIHFLHKSVVDFVQKPEVWGQLRMSTSLGGFDPNVSLASASLREIKAAACEFNRPIDQSTVWPLLVRAMHECSFAESSTGAAQDLLLDELDAVMNWHWRKVNGWIPRFGKSLEEMGHWSHTVPTEDSKCYWNHGAVAYDSMFSLSCRFGLTKFVRKQLESSKTVDGGDASSAGLAQSALHRVILDIDESSVDQRLWNLQVEILELSCLYGANVNIPFFYGLSAWQLAVSRCNPRNVSSCQDWDKILHILVEAGADLDNGTHEVTNLYFWSHRPEWQGRSDFRIWRSSLEHVRDSFLATEKLIRPKSRTSAHKVRLIFEGLQAMLLKKNAIYKRWVEQSAMKHHNGRPVKVWKKIVDPDMETEILRSADMEFPKCSKMR
jgi:hypothetical protein